MAAQPAQQGMEALLKRLDLPPIGLHAFGRHGAVTNAAGAGIDIAFIMRLTGHATREMVDHYTHLGVASSRTAAEALELAYAQRRHEADAQVGEGEATH